MDGIMSILKEFRNRLLGFNYVSFLDKIEN